ncbi:hypothetical protein BC939DRAFT_472769 [Gamsiella multidivaricata]|uniref:uncharacterized protein n=1 Tax=Gamsiella multidivaricata TaxID=101098 RepID=UPI002220E578|nr:uncharacterized protein BC939DRAFT_472769 [Gamsiella multidivaricata]KAG0353821.1 hypothetical protein BGZ54_002026 [Gamsiella multidivaricata]KAI7831651.1 hypothetical protein BC939DRAFT_472769 [Gamsiella multidivaricata]
MGYPQEPPSYSAYQPTQYLQSPRVCCITLNECDKLRLIGTPPELSHQIRQAIATSWGRIQREANYSGAHEFKLMGNPWLGQGIEAVRSRRLLTGVLRTMAQNGWNLIQAADVSKKQGDKDSLFFESVSQATGIVDVGAVEMFAMSFNRTDRIRLIDAPADIPALIKHAVQTQWKFGIQQEQIYDTSYEFKLRGNPFVPCGVEAVVSRMMLSQILANLRAIGFKLYASVDISVGTEGQDVESWVFRRVGPAWS